MDRTFRLNLPRSIAGLLAGASEDERTEISRWALDLFMAGAESGILSGAVISKPAAPLSRAERLAARDTAIRAALANHYGDLPLTVAAKSLSADWTRYVSACWPRERDLAEVPGDDPKRAALHKITRFNDGDSLSARQIANIGIGFRGR